MQTSSVDDPRARYAWLTEESSLWTLQTELALSPLTHLASLCEENGIRLLFAAHPAPWQLSATASRGARNPGLNGIYPGTLIDTTRPQELISEFAATAALPYCDTISILRGHASVDDLFQPDSVEFSEIGHRYYAAALTASLLERFPDIVAPVGGYSPESYPPKGRLGGFGQPAPLPQPDRLTQQPASLQPVRPAGFYSGPYGAANQPASTQEVPRQQRQNLPANALVPHSDRR